MPKDNLALRLADNIETDDGEGGAPSFTPRDEHVGFLLWDARRALSRDLTQRLAAVGISSGVFAALRVLWEENSLTQAEIARRGRMTGPTIAGVVNQLERQKLVQRVTLPDDTRKRRIVLTEEGEALRKVVLPIVEEISARALTGFSAQERVQLKFLLRRIRDNFTPPGEL